MQQTQTAQISTVTTDANVVVQAVMAMALGLFIVGVVGFSHISAVHNAAHDIPARQRFSLPLIVTAAAMSVFRSIVFSAALAGLIAGAATTAVQMVGTVSLIQRAEVYERKPEAPAAAPATAAPATATATTTSGHDHSAQQNAASAHDHGAEWEPQDGFQRNAFTAGANILTAVGFALLLAGIFALRGRAVDWREGLFWGLGGFVVFTMAPGLGLPPELPGMPVADLTLRQTWWICTACATAAGLGLLVFRKASWAALLGLGLIVLPHLIGAPQAPAGHTDVPHTLAHSFVVAVTVTSLLFWALLGVLTSIAFRRISRA